MAPRDSVDQNLNQGDLCDHKSKIYKKVKYSRDDSFEHLFLSESDQQNVFQSSCVLVTQHFFFAQTNITPHPSVKYIGYVSCNNQDKKKDHLSNAHPLFI